MRETAAFIAARPGPALCETLALCYWAGKPFAVDTFNVGQAVRVGALDESVLDERIAAGEFSSVQTLTAPDSPPTALPPGSIVALRAHYASVPVTAIIGEIFVPK